MAAFDTLLQRVQAALADPTPTPLEELLLLRDREGKLGRTMEPSPGITPRESAVLLLLAPVGDDLLLPLTVRSADLVHHSGEVSLPGGATDPDDAGPAATALREAHEELGIEPSSVQVLGTLRPIYIPPSNFRLTPVVGFVPTLPTLLPNPREVDVVLLVALNQLLDPATVQIEEWERRGMQLQVPFFAIQGYKVWGATALVLSELVARLRRVTSHE